MSCYVLLCHALSCVVMSQVLSRADKSKSCKNGEPVAVTKSKRIGYRLLSFATFSLTFCLRVFSRIILVCPSLLLIADNSFTPTFYLKLLPIIPYPLILLPTLLTTLYIIYVIPCILPTVPYHLHYTLYITYNPLLPTVLHYTIMNHNFSSLRFNLHNLNQWLKDGSPIMLVTMSKRITALQKVCECSVHLQYYLVKSSTTSIKMTVINQEWWVGFILSIT